MSSKNSLVMFIKYYCNRFIRTCVNLLGVHVLKPTGCYLRVFTESLFFQFSITNKILLNFGDCLSEKC